MVLISVDLPAPLADQRDHLAGADLEGQPVEGDRRAVADDEVIDLQHATLPFRGRP